MECYSAGGGVALGWSGKNPDRMLLPQNVRASLAVEQGCAIKEMKRPMILCIPAQIKNK
jgi:hypothetical protein